MGDLRVGSNDASSSGSKYCLEMNTKIFDNRSNCNLVDVYLMPKINNPDLTIKIPAHKLILQNCQFFAKLLETSTSSNRQGPVDLQLNSDPISIEIILKYIYTGQVDLNGENCMKLLVASKYFEISRLREKCIKFLLCEDKSNLNVNNWVDLFRYAVAEGGRGFRQKIFEFLRSISDQLIHSDDLPTLDRNEIKLLLKPSNRIFASQKDFNKVILNWITFKADRREHIDELSNLKWDNTIVVDLLSDNEDEESDNDQNPGPSNHQNGQNNQIHNTHNDQMVKRPRLSVHHQIIFLVQNIKPNPDSLYTFSFEEQKITKLIDMPIECYGFGLISTKKKFFLLGGCRSESNNIYSSDTIHSFILKPAEEHLSVSQSWKREINLLQKLCQFSTVYTRGSIYVVGGESDPGESIRDISSITLAENDNVQKCDFFCNMKMNRSQAGVAVLGNILYISGGLCSNRSRTDYSNPLNTFEMVNLETKLGKILPNMMYQRFSHRLVTFNDKIYAIGGIITYNGEQRSVEIYCPVSGKWTLGESLLDARSGFVAFATESNIFVLGGNRGKPKMEKFDPITSLWSRIECPKFPHYANFCNPRVHITNY